MDLADALRLLDHTLQRPIAYHRVFADLTGKITAGLMLSQAYYWSHRTGDNDGWFYKSQAEWQEETGLGRHEQESARKRLRESGLMEEQRRGLPAKLYFRVRLEKMAELLLAKTPAKTQYAGNQQPRMQVSQSGTPDRRNPADKSAGMSQSFLIDSETTTETTTETTAPPPEPKPKARARRGDGTRIPEPFLLTAKMREWAASKAPDVDPVRTTEAFVYHWRGKAGKDGRKVDWLATWYSWMLKEQGWAEQRNNGHRPQPKSKVEMSLEAARQVAAKFREGDDTQS